MENLAVATTTLIDARPCQETSHQTDVTDASDISAENGQPRLPHGNKEAVNTLDNPSSPSYHLSRPSRPWLVACPSAKV